MSKNPQAVLDVLEFYSENLAPKEEPRTLQRAGTDPIPLNRVDLRPPNVMSMRPTQSIMDMNV
jgi:hypothetical protein